jgi:hypothetical protein
MRSRPAATTGPLWRAIEAHLRSRDVAPVIYAAMIGQALVVELEQHPPTTERRRCRRYRASAPANSL